MVASMAEGPISLAASSTCGVRLRAVLTRDQAIITLCRVEGVGSSGIQLASSMVPEADQLISSVGSWSQRRGGVCDGEFQSEVA
jgi:hypothetical protein